MQAALEAAQPNQRQKALASLDQDILAKSTNPAAEARVRTYLALCRAWEVPGFPLDCHNIRCFGASLKAGGYRSAAVYFQAICGHQQRVLRTPVPAIVKLGIRDCVRSIQRGLGERKLKDSFNGLLIGNMAFSTDELPFSFENIAHCRDMAVIGMWFMLREVEMASARAGDLRLEGREVCLCIPIHKTDHKGRFTERSLTCSCTAKIHGLCVWHSSERHLLRLEAHCQDEPRQQLPPFPDQGGSHRLQADVHRGLQEGHRAHWHRADTHGPRRTRSQRFHGHVLRISGAQMLSSSGVELALIQLLGRWTSTAVLRYTQDSALIRVPNIPQQVLSGDDSHVQKIQMQVVQSEAAASSVAPVGRAPAPAARPKALAADIRGLRAELDQVRQAVQKPPQTYVFRPKAKILHKSSQYEENNEPSRWRTPCGWNYGCKTFLRTTDKEDGTRKCRKCFNLSDASSSDSSEESSGLSDLADSSASSAEDD